MLNTSKIIKTNFDCFKSLPENLNDINYAYENQFENEVDNNKNDAKTNLLDDVGKNKNKEILPENNSGSKKSNSLFNVLLSGRPKRKNYNTDKNQQQKVAKNSEDIKLSNLNKDKKTSAEKQVVFKLSPTSSCSSSEIESGKVKLINNSSSDNQNQKLKFEEESDSGLCSASEEQFDYYLLSSTKKETSISEQLEEHETSELSEKSEDKTDTNKEKKFDKTFKRFQSLNQHRNRPDIYFKNRAFTTIKKSINKAKQERSSLGFLNPNDLPINKPNSPKLNNLKFEMPSLIEINEINHHSKILTTPPASSSNHGTPIHDSRNLSIIINECDDNLDNGNTNARNLNENTASNSNLSAVYNNQPELTKQNILASLEYLINNSKGNLNTKIAIANIAAAAAVTDSDDMNNDNVLQTLLMDLMVPPLAVSSQLDLSSTASTDANDLSLIYQINNNESLVNLQNNKQFELNTSNLNTIVNLNSNSATIINGSNTNTNFNACYQTPMPSFNKKQINEQIMRTCMGYLDFINQKHTRERRLQTIKNKISGFVMLTIVFLVIFGLAMIMTFFITNALTNIIKKRVSSIAGSAEDSPGEGFNVTKQSIDEDSQGSINVDGLNALGLINLHKNELDSSIYSQKLKIKTNLTSSNHTLAKPIGIKRHESIDLVRNYWELSIKNEIKKFINNLHTNIIFNKTFGASLRSNLDKNLNTIQIEIFKLIFTSSQPISNSNELNSYVPEETSLHYMNKIEEINK